MLFIGYSYDLPGGRSLNLLEIKNLSYDYDYDNETPILKELDLCLANHMRIGVAGHTGSGKTTLLKTIMGLIQPKTGTICIEGHDCYKKSEFIQARKIFGYLLQDSNDQLFLPTLIEDVAFGPLNLGVSSPDAKIRSQQCLDFVGLSGFANRLTHTLSSGEKRLAALAGILAMQPKCLLLDEPTANLDPSSQMRVRDILGNLNLAMLVVSHDQDFLSQVTSHQFVLNDGKLHRIK